MNVLHKIDLTNKWQLYQFSSKDIPEDFGGLGFGNSNEEARVKKLAADGGFVIIPSPRVTESQIEESLANENYRKGIMNNLAQDKPLNGLLGLLSFKSDYSNIIEDVEILKTRSSPTNGIYSENEVIITLKQGIDVSVGDLNIDITISGVDYKESDGLGFDDSTEVIEDLDIITQAIYYDDNDNKMFEEYLIPNSINDLFQASVDVNLNSEPITDGQDSDGLGFAPPLLKKIKLFFKKIVGTIRRELIKWKNKSIDFIIEKLKPIKRTIHDPYKILKFNFADNDFEECLPSDVEPSKKTLIFLHGTAKGSFDGRLKKNNEKGSFKYLNSSKFKFEGQEHDNWFKFFKNYSGFIKYEQIIALEHETIMDSPMDNIERFLTWQLRFNQPVSIVSASRGGLLAKCISNTSLSTLIPIERVAIVSGGHSEYFNEKKGIKRYVNMIGNLIKLNLPLKFLLSLTADIIIRLPGLKVQNKTTDEFKFLVNPDNVVDKNNPVYYFNMTSNYQPTRPRGKLLKKLASTILGEQNDLAVSLDAQRDFDPGRVHPRFSLLVGSGQHGRGLKYSGAKKRLLEFLTADLDDNV